MSLCPCGSQLELENCCLPIIEGTKLAATAEALMRARYTAHAIKSYAFLNASTHPEFREDVDLKDIEAWSSAMEWERLDILHKERGEENDTDGEVSFKASYSMKGIPQDLTEDAFFRKEGDSWYYVEGNVHSNEPFKRKQPKVGRNEPCPCGSGKKYKKCCGQDQ